jgi:hypothetical protein
MKAAGRSAPQQAQVPIDKRRYGRTISEYRLAMHANASSAAPTEQDSRTDIPQSKAVE